MKKMNLTKLMAVLVVLCLITSTFVGSTLAKYVTEANGADTARVAKFGVVLKASSDIFAPKYDNGAISVQADDSKDVVAPGTAGTITAFEIAGAPEVDVQLDVTLNKDDALAMVTVPVGEYLDWTTGDDTTDKYKVETNPYYPVVWTLKHNGTIEVSGNLQEIQDYLTTELSGKYEVEDPTQFAAILGEWTLDWAWEFENGKDKEDTTLGNKAAGITDATAADVLLDETFKFNIKATQID